MHTSAGPTPDHSKERGNRFNWQKIRSLIAFGDSYTYVQGLLGHPNYTYIGDNFDIKRVDGTDLFDVEGKLLSISSKKEFRLAKVKTAENPKGTKGPLLFTIRKKHIALHTTFLLEDETGKDLAEIKNHMKRKDFEVFVYGNPNVK